MSWGRLFGGIVAVVVAAVLVAPGAVAERPVELLADVTDSANVLTPAQQTAVESAVDKLYADRKTRLWVIYVDDFSGQDPASWAQSTRRLSDLGEYDALLAVATANGRYAFLVPEAATELSADQVGDLQRTEIEPALGSGDWGVAAIAAANGLNTSGGGLSWVGLLIALGVVALAITVLMLVTRRRRRRRKEAEFAAAKRVDPTDANALAAVSLDALDDLSKTMVVDVDNAVRSSDNELALAVEEFGAAKTEPFTAAVDNAKTTLAQAFTVRQQLDDAIAETPAQRRELLTRVVVSAGRADRELDAQTEAFQKLRDLVINAPTKLDNLTQHLVDVTARIGPSEQRLTALHTEFADAALVSVAQNVRTAQERAAFADQNVTRARELAARPVTGAQGELVDCVRAAESALGQARSLLDAIDSAAGDIRRAVAALPSAITDIQAGIAAADSQLHEGNAPSAAKLTAARAAAVKAVEIVQASGTADPLGAFTTLTKADADLDQLIASVEEERAAAQRLSRAFDQALFTAQSRVRTVSDYIDTRRGSIGPEARTRLSEAVRQLEAAQAKQSTNVTEAIAHANGASMLAAHAQSLANADVQAAERVHAGSFGGGGGSNAGAVIGGIIIGNILSGALRGGFSGGWSPTGFGGSSGGGGGMLGGGGRF